MQRKGFERDVFPGINANTTHLAFKYPSTIDLDQTLLERLMDLSAEELKSQDKDLILLNTQTDLLFPPRNRIGMPEDQALLIQNMVDVLQFCLSDYRCVMLGGALIEIEFKSKETAAFIAPSFAKSFIQTLLQRFAESEELCAFPALLKPLVKTHVLPALLLYFPQEMLKQKEFVLTDFVSTHFYKRSLMQNGPLCQQFYQACLFDENAPAALKDELSEERLSEKNALLCYIKQNKKREGLPGLARSLGFFSLPKGSLFVDYQPEYGFSLTTSALASKAN